MKTLLILMLLASNVAAPQADWVKMTFRNNSVTSIYLQIPGVMNPNLSPLSNSGVSLEIGQEVFFFYKKKKQLLLKITTELDGQTLLINELVKAREKEIDAERLAKKKNKKD